jgi:hypothetical protein
MTYSVNNIRIDNTLVFGTGATAGYVLAIEADGSTYWSSPQSGSSGASGSSGTSGSSGSSGVNGTEGSSGSSGVNGTSGTSGSSGTSGVSGTSGSSPIGNIIISPSSPNNIIDIWSGSQVQYNALSPTYSTTTIYFIE